MYILTSLMPSVESTVKLHHRLEVLLHQSNESLYTSWNLLFFLLKFLLAPKWTIPIFQLRNDHFSNLVKTHSKEKKKEKEKEIQYCNFIHSSSSPPWGWCHIVLPSVSEILVFDLLLLSVHPAWVFSAAPFYLTSPHLLVHADPGKGPGTENLLPQGEGKEKPMKEAGPTRSAN